jgi:glycosyltransferase involved in cell wall biosynthesis
VTRFALGTACRQIGVSRAVLESLAAAGIPASRGIVIPNGVDWQRFQTLPDRGEARRSLGLGDEPIVLYLGRLTVEKGVRILARAAHHLAECRPNLVVLVAGEGPERANLEREAARSPALRLLGHRDDVPVLLSACDVVVAPSLREGQSLVALEALAAGRAIVASAVGGLAELAAESGAVRSVPAGEPALLAEALDDLLADANARARLGERGRLYVRTKGGWDAMVERVVAVYREVIDEG